MTRGKAAAQTREEQQREVDWLRAKGVPMSTIAMIRAGITREDVAERLRAHLRTLPKG